MKQKKYHTKIFFFPVLVFLNVYTSVSEFLFTITYRMAIYHNVCSKHS